MAHGSRRALTAAAIVIATGCRRLPETPSIACDGVTIRLGSRLDGHGALVEGRGVVCGGPIGDSVADAVRGLPVDAGLDRVVVHHDPALPIGGRAISGVEAHRPTRSLLAARDGASIDRAIWSHELAHLAMAGERPSHVIGARILSAIEEGSCDYVAAVAIGTSALPTRDLAKPPRRSAHAWSRIAFDDFDPHALGHQWAALMWREAPSRGALLDDVVACMAGARFDDNAVTVRDTVDAWIAGCPARSRDVIGRMVEDWLPEQFE
jgi:hypothetical protein